ncbi:lysylphosphatidylglycerol synthase transmembrane domain-containing protein [Azospirillum sp.]|uniref:lysylphosphatidylglycerol synthase transmembrane domain-containing protein n=1 Tax=Azospirillum sp. TaxID=34012 RepID=UPI002D388DAA|nr:lysylphosphatidylglycerol synthase transmembrane domain-containing protein [Azospirillum sp.]HYD64650.1 lysylphosphatidylglycerol synthase transmembrane domain-containing protein [Azospirillum sp.]
MKRAVHIAVGLLILAALYAQVDPGAVAGSLARSSPLWLAAGLAVSVPITVVMALRFTLLFPAGRGIGLGEAVRLVLIAGTLNLILPSNMGQIAKAYPLSRRSGFPLAHAVATVVAEKGWDTVALLLWCLFGLLAAGAAVPFRAPALAVVAALLAAGLVALTWAGVTRIALLAAARRLPATAGSRVTALADAWGGVIGRFWGDRRRAAAVVGLSLLIWLLSLGQVWLFTVALGAGVPFLACLSLAPLAILVGLLPVTIGGIGTRDAALVLLFQPFMDAGTAAALGVLCTLRYLLPAIAGLPLVRDFHGPAQAMPDR